MGMSFVWREVRIFLFHQRTKRNMRHRNISAVIVSSDVSCGPARIVEVHVHEIYL